MLVLSITAKLSLTVCWSQVSTRMFSQHMPAHLLLTMQRLAKDRTGNTQARPPVPASLGVAL